MTVDEDSNRLGEATRGYFVPARELNPDETLDLRAFFNDVRRHWIIAAITTVISVLIAGTWAYLADPIYRAETTVVPVNSSESASQMLSLAGQLSGLTSIGLGMDESEINEALAILQSRQFTAEFIVENDLLPLIFNAMWDEDAERWDSPDNEAPTLNDAYSIFDQQIRRVSRDGLSGLVTISIEWQDPVVAASWANSLVDRLNGKMRSRAIVESERSIEYLMRQLEESSLIEVRQGLSRLIESEVSKAAIARSRSQYLFRVVDPAVAPDEDDYVRPKRAVTVLAGGFFGCFLGLLLILFVGKSDRQTA